MAVPKRTDRMIERFMKIQNKNKNPLGCNKQFPDCPAEPNEKDCKSCPFWKKYVGK